jgi:hypothetical protein
MVRCKALSVADAALSALSMKTDTTWNGLAFSIGVCQGGREQGRGYVEDKMKKIWVDRGNWVGRA